MLTVGNFSLPVNDIYFENIKQEILYAHVSVVKSMSLKNIPAHY